MVIPLYDDDPLDRGGHAVVTYSIIAINLLIFAVELTASAAFDEILLRNFGVFPVAITGQVATGGVLPPALAVFTYMFLHAGWGHILFNMLFLWVFGDNIEDALGRFRFLVFYLLCGAAGAVAFIVSEPSIAGPLVGASGAIAGVVGAYLVLRPCAKVRVLLGPIPLKLDAFWILGFWALTQVWHVLVNDQPGVAWWAHVGGLVAGAVLAVVMRQPGVRLFACMRPRVPSANGPA